ncbi:MAG: 1,4-dihydroxy-2-naphthoate octaprenyltransferase [Bacteroidota bacterium]
MKLNLRAWVAAFRFRTLPLVIAGWLVGITLASMQAQINYTTSILTLLTAVLLQVLSNLANDYGDGVSGVDQHREGEARMVQKGLIKPEHMRLAMVICSIASFLSGLLLIYLVFPNDYLQAIIFVSIGVAGIVAAIKYTVGENPYGYAGFGDVFVFLFFGIALVFGTFYLQTKIFDWQILMPAASIGLFSVGVLNVNNIRDINSDKAAGKQSIPVRIGRKRAVIYHIFLLQGGMLLSMIYAVINYRSFWCLLFIPINIFFLRNVTAVSEKPYNQLDPYLKQVAISTLFFSFLFSFGQYLSWVL